MENKRTETNKTVQKKAGTGTETHQHGYGGSGADRMATLSIYSLWKSNNYTGRSGRRKNDNGASDYCKTDQRRAYSSS